MLAYLVLLHVEIARFTPATSAAGLVSVALILASRRRGITSYVALCSPDLPPVPPFGYGTSNGLACFTGVDYPLFCRKIKEISLILCILFKFGSMLVTIQRSDGMGRGYSLPNPGRKDAFI